MRTMVIAEPEAEFAAWEANERGPAIATTTDAAARGAQLFADMTCVKCHGIASAAPNAVELPRVAPDLTHIARRKTLAAGRLDNTPANLAAWLKDPQAIKPGSHMPSLQLTDAKVADLVAYFESLQ
jgi:cytochrome c oxidase subunit 2